MKKIHFLFLILIYCLTLGVRIYWLTQKDGLHVDEGLSLVIACYKDYMVIENYEFDQEYTGKQIKEMTLSEEGGLKNILEDIKLLRNENRDHPHTNLYFSLLRVFIGELETGDIKDFIFRGGLLNLLLFTVSFFVFFLLMKNLFNKSKIIPLIAVFCTFISTATISNTLFLRMYQLQETLFIIFVYALYRFIRVQKIIILDKKLYIPPIPVCLMIVITALVLLSGYYAVFFLFLFSLYIGYYCISQKNIKEIGLYVMILFCAILSAEFLYLKYTRGFVSYRAVEAKGKLFGDGVIDNLNDSMNAVLLILKDYYFSIPVIVVIIALILYLYFSKSKFSLQVFMSVVFVVSIVYTIIVTYLAPIKTVRYAMPVFPFLIILPVLLLQSIKNKKIFLFSSVVLCIGFSLNALNINKIEYVFRNKPKQYLFTQNPEIPVLVVAQACWLYADLVPYLDDNQTYIFNDKFDFNTKQYDRFYIVVEKGLVPEIIKTIPNCCITETFDSDLFTGMKIDYSCSLKE